MKKLVAILAVVCAALALALFRAQRNGDAALDRARADLSSLSNRAAELEIKLNHQERLAGALGNQLTNCTETLSRRTAELDRARVDLGQAGADHKAAEARLEAVVQTRRQLETQLHELRERNHALESELQQANQRAQSLVRQLEELANRHNQTSLALAATHVELVQLRASLTNPTLLRAHLDALASPPRVSPPKSLVNSQQPKPAPPLQLRPDGTVQVVE